MRFSTTATVALMALGSTGPALAAVIPTTNDASTAQLNPRDYNNPNEYRPSRNRADAFYGGVAPFSSKNDAPEIKWVPGTYKDKQRRPPLPSPPSTPYNHFKEDPDAELLKGDPDAEIFNDLDQLGSDWVYSEKADRQTGSRNGFYSDEDVFEDVDLGTVPTPKKKGGFWW